MMWAAVHCHRLELDLALRGHPDLHEPVAVCSGLLVLQANAAAQERGIQPGLRRASALSILPELRLIEHRPAAVQEGLEQVAAWLLQFTPGVSLQPPEGIVLDLQASLRLFGGRPALLARIRNGLTALGFSVHLACAPTARAAWLLVRWRDGACIEHPSLLEAGLSALPIGLLHSAARHGDALAAIGAHRFADLARLPRDGLARRYGPLLLTEIDTALGRQAEPRAWFEAPARFAIRLELLAQVERAEALLFGAQRLLQQLCGWLAARHSATRDVLLCAEHESGRHACPPTSIALRLSAPSRDPERLLAVLRERLGLLQLPAPVHTLSLSCDRIVALGGQAGTLFPSPDADSEDLGRLIERLQSRLGHDQVQRLHLVCDHRPEAAYRTDPVDRLPHGPTRRAGPRAAAARPSSQTLAEPRSHSPEQPPDPGSPVPLVTAGMPRPLWLLDPPVPLAEQRQRPVWHGPLTLLTGPERIETGWWDGHPIQRDYFIAEDETAGWVWIYRTRSSDTQVGWFLQGMFG